MKSIEERVADAQVELDLVILASRTTIPELAGAWGRVFARAEKRLSDLIAVRDGKAVEIYAGAGVDEHGNWRSHGHSLYEPTLEYISNATTRKPGCRLTVVRAIAFLPVTDVAEAEAESEDA